MTRQPSFTLARPRRAAASLGAAWAVWAAALGAGAPAAAAPYKPPSTQVAWRPAATDADIDRVFAMARAQKKPVLLYWGATWCPPCNQLKATLFNRQDFAEQARSFLAVHVDGDLPGAQKLGARFKVRGYPTVILFDAAGTELTRLPGEVEAAQVMAVLQQGLAGGRPVKALLADARAARPLTPNDWRALAFYSWDTDEQQLVKPADRAALLAQLAAASTDEASATRLWLKALAESDDGKGIRADAALRERVSRVLADPARTRAQMDVLSNAAPDLVRALSAEDSPERAALLPAFEAALKRLDGDATLSRGDRLSALGARVELARLEVPVDATRPAPLSPGLLAEVRTYVERADKDIVDPYERQAVITASAWVLMRAGLMAESDALLKGNLARSESPYYLMSQLADNARRRGDNAEALRWFEQAYSRSEGPATRLQWGASYLNALVDMAPADAGRIERTARALFDEAAKDPGAFYERSARSLKRIGSKLAAWNEGGRHAAAMRRLQAQLDGICARVPAADGQRAACTGLLSAG